MTLLERDAWLHPDPAVTNVTDGYPAGLTPGWIREYQQHPPAGFLKVPPGEYVSVICGRLAGFLGAGDIMLTQTCSLAFAVAAGAVIRPGDEAVVLDRSYDSWPRLLAALGARVVYARRGDGGLPDPEAVAAACTSRTRALVIVSPDNPLGTICPAPVLRELGRLCRERDMTLIADHCLAAVNPLQAHIPLLPRVAGRGLSWAALGDTGKILGLGGTKLGALACAGSLRERIEAAASAWFFLIPAYDLAVIASVLSDGRFLPYLLELSSRVRMNFLRLREETAPELAVTLRGAGPFALVDAAGLGLDGESFAALLDKRHSALVVPVSWFPSGEPVRETRVRVSLACGEGTITRLIGALNRCAADLAP